MPVIQTDDGVEIFYKDWGTGQPIVFSHGWPLSSDDWDNQMLFFLQQGYRVIAHDRRGHGRSTQVDNGHDMDHYADDLLAVVEFLDLENVIHVGHSTGGGEVAHYLGRHGEKRAAKAALISAVTPFMLKTESNPLGLPKSVFDDLQAQLFASRAQFYCEDADAGGGELVAARDDGWSEGALRRDCRVLADGFERGPEEDFDSGAGDA
jgi:non-heme chloroperoxidase